MVTDLPDFTAGPWTNDGILIYTEGRGLFEGLVATAEGINNDNEANARLIAKAPELLERLEALADIAARFSKVVYTDGGEGRMWDNVIEGGCQLDLEVEKAQELINELTDTG